MRTGGSPGLRLLVAISRPGAFLVVDGLGAIPLGLRHGSEINDACWERREIRGGFDARGRNLEERQKKVAPGGARSLDTSGAPQFRRRISPDTACYI